MTNKVKVNKINGEVYIKSSSSREQSAVILKKIEGIVSFPIKVEEVEGNKSAKTIYSLYYEDTLLNESVIILTFDKKEDAVLLRKEIERAYNKSSILGMSKTIKNVLGVMAILCLAKYLMLGNPIIQKETSNNVSPTNIEDQNYGSTYDREALMKTVNDYKKKQLEENNKNQEKALQESTDNDSMQESSDKNYIGERNKQLAEQLNASDSSDTGKTPGEQFADFLNNNASKK